MKATDELRNDLAGLHLKVNSLSERVDALGRTNERIHDDEQTRVAKAMQVAARAWARAADSQTQDYYRSLARAALSAIRPNCGCGDNS
jgi:hypothetical protein